MKVIARRALVATLPVGAAALSLVALASGVRLLPLLLDPAVAMSTALAFFRILTVPGSQTVLLVALPTGFALAAVDLVASGEARALAAVGASPWGLAARTLPAVALLLLAPALLAARYGASAQQPGMLAMELLARAETACRVPRRISRVPWMSAVVLCSGSERVVLFSDEATVLRARAARLFPDLSGVALSEARVDLRGPPAVRVEAVSLIVRGVSPFALPVSGGGAGRTAAVLGSSALSALATFAALIARRERRRTAALAVSGTAPALLALAALEQNGLGGLSLLAVPVVSVLPVIAFLLLTAASAGARIR